MKLLAVRPVHKIATAGGKWGHTGDAQDQWTENYLQPKGQEAQNKLSQPIPIAVLV